MVSAHATTRSRRDPSLIRNKIKRREVVGKIRSAKKLERSKLRRERQKIRQQLGDKAPPIQPQKTLENLREHDETITREIDAEVQAEQDMDEFSNYFNGKSKPNIAITTARRATKRSYDFIHDLLHVLSNSTFFERRNFNIKAIVDEAIVKGFTDLIIINEDRKVPNAIIIIHLPGGPTAHFKLSNVVLNKEIKGHGQMTAHQPEVILNNFVSRLGQRLGRMLASLFHQQPEFRGRRVATFHNQRDFIFFRQHRYIFDEQGKVAELQELGPQFTLKLRSLQHGVFDSAHGEYEWKHRAELNTSRRKFFI